MTQPTNQPLPPHNEMELYTPYMYINDDELNWLLQNLQLEEPDSDGGNSNNNNNASFLNLPYVQLFTVVGSCMHELFSRTGLAPENKGRNWVQRTKGVPTQQPDLTSTQPKEATSPWLHVLYLYSHACVHMRSCRTCRHFL